MPFPQIMSLVTTEKFHDSHIPVFFLEFSVSSLALHSWKGQGMPVGLLEGSETPGWEEVSRGGCQVLWRRGDC